MNQSRLQSLRLNLTASAALLGASLALADSAGTADREMIVALDEFNVTGTRPNVVDASSLKMATTVLETPRSVTVMDSARLTAQDFQNADDVLNWIPGMNSNAGSYHFFARGFRMLPNDWRVDGFAGRVVGGSYSPNLFGFEQVVALKGPAGVLYGASGSPGGQVSLLTKKPKNTAATTASVRIRTYSGSEAGFGEQLGAEFEFDSTGPVDRAGRLRYRFLASLEDAAERPAAEDENQFYRLSFAYDLDAAKRFEVLPVVEWSREIHAARGSAISPATSRTVTDGRTDSTLADATPRDVNLAAGDRTDDNFTAGFDLNARFTDAWRAAAAFRFHDRSYENNAWAVQTATLTQTHAGDPTSWVVSRRHTRAKSDYEDTTLDVNSTYEFSPVADLKTVAQAGLNVRWNDTQAYTATNGANQSPINVLTGDAATPLVADAPNTLTPTTLTRTKEWNLYTQLRTTWRDRLSLNVSTAWVGDKVGAVKRTSDTTPNFGLVYLPTKKLSVYASYSSSYSLPNATYENAAGQTGTFGPTEGDSYEAGVKAELWGDLVAASASVFQAELNNTLVQSETNELNPNGNRYYRQLDAGRKSRGVELEFTIAPVKGWNNTFTYAYLDAHDRNPDGSRAGRASMTPRHAFSLFSRYSFAPDSRLAGWSAQFGVLAQSERIGGQSALSATNPDPLTLDAFHRFDAGVSRRWKAWTASLNIENVTDEDYLLGGSTGLNLERANPRTLTVRVSRSW